MPSAINWRIAADRDQMRRSARQASKASTSLGVITTFSRTSFFSMVAQMHGGAGRCNKSHLRIIGGLRDMRNLCEYVVMHDEPRTSYRTTALLILGGMVFGVIFFVGAWTVAAWAFRALPA